MRRKLLFFTGAAVVAVAGVAGRRRTRANDYLRGRAPVTPSRVAAGTPSRDELYEHAKALDIPGRSRMRKAELERAVAERTSGAAA